jgi:PAS domain S-box-containing protein
MTHEELVKEVATLRALQLDTEDQLRRFVQAVEQGPVTVVITDVAGNIEYVNPKFEEVTGYSAAEVTGQNPRILKSGKTSDDQYEELWSTISSGREWRGVFLNRKKNGDHFWERATISPVIGVNGKTTHYVGVKEDITDLRRIEADIEEQRLKYFHQSKMAEVGLLAASILHEVANPVAAIHGIISAMLQDLEKDQKSEEHAEDLRLVLSLTHRLTDITREIAEFSSPQPDKIELVDLNGIIRSTCHLAQLDQRWRNITLSIDLDQQIPAIMGYKDQLSHLLINLLSNATDAVNEEQSRQPIISVRTACEGNQVVLTVKDNGVGMSQDVIERATDAFFTTKKAGQGTGLGLSLCDSIIEAHGAEMKIKSLIGVGTEMSIYLPLSEET